jgi:hypothetical protein
MGLMSLIEKNQASQEFTQKVVGLYAAIETASHQADQPLSSTNAEATSREKFNELFAVLKPIWEKKIEPDKFDIFELGDSRQPGRKVFINLATGAFLSGQRGGEIGDYQKTGIEEVADTDRPTVAKRLIEKVTGKTVEELKNGR